MGRGGSACCGGDENEEDEVDYDPANKGDNPNFMFSEVILSKIMRIYFRAQREEIMHRRALFHVVGDIYPDMGSHSSIRIRPR